MKNIKVKLLVPAMLAIASTSALADGATGPLETAATTLAGFGSPITAALAAAAGLLALFVAYKFLRKIFGS